MVGRKVWLLVQSHVQNLLFLTAINWEEFLPARLVGAQYQFAATFSGLSVLYRVIEKDGRDLKPL